MSVEGEIDGFGGGVGIGGSWLRSVSHGGLGEFISPLPGWWFAAVAIG